MKHIQLFGLDNELASFTDEDHLVCMVSNIHKKEVLLELKKMGKKKFKIGDWFVSSGSCSGIVINGPFKKMEDALDFGKSTYNAVKYSGVPQFEEFEG